MSKKKGSSSNFGNGFSGRSGTGKSGQKNSYSWKTGSNGKDHCHAFTNGKSSDGSDTTVRSGVQHRGGCESCSSGK